MRSTGDTDLEFRMIKTSWSAVKYCWHIRTGVNDIKQNAEANHFIILFTEKWKILVMTNEICSTKKLMYIQYTSSKVENSATRHIT